MLTLGRVHEICGQARHTLALEAAAACEGPVLWIVPAWQGTRLHPEGVNERIDPARLLMLPAPRREDLLWAMEQALRSGTVPLVVAEVPELPGLTPVRRLHLAVEGGAAASTGTAPIGLLLTSETGGATGVESRWSLSVVSILTGEAWNLERLHSRSAPPAHWLVKQHQAGRDGRFRLRRIKLSNNSPI